jgi:diguanylate cyclase (GGDEF)-like protein
MSDVDGFLAEEAVRLANCVQEPIRTPGAVQPHGVFVAVNRDNLDIVAVSHSSEELFSAPATSLIGMPLRDLIGDDGVALVRSSHPGDDVEPSAITVAQTTFDLIVSDAGEHLFLEFEPVMADAVSVAALFTAMRRLSKARTNRDLWDDTARELRQLLAFDRVMVYHFHPDEHGEVVAEERADEMEPYRGLHYPASDIPAQARELYLTKLSRVIADSGRPGSDLVTVAGLTLDLSVAELRSVSPHHLEFMHNMGQASTFSLSLVRDDRLIGMITCAHRTPKRLPFAVRKALEALADQVALQLGSMTDIVRLEKDAEYRGVRDVLVGRVAATGDLDDALFRGDPTVLDLVRASGAALYSSGVVSTVGDTPPVGELLAFFGRVPVPVAAAFATDSLHHEHPDLETLLPSVAGVIVVPVGVEGQLLAWFRPEVAQTVDWLGDLSKSNRATTLSPRTSFSAWTESVTARSLPWGRLPAEAEALARDVEKALARIRDGRLAGLAMHDALTGLPNRRMFMDRVENALLTATRAVDVSVLFIDLDGFKQINDTLGHEVGDAILQHAASQLLAATRGEDTVARLGGDEFVVLCERTLPEDLDHVAERILAALKTPLVVGDTTVAVTASVGAFSGNAGATASDLLRSADAAMYRAKLAGRDRASR